MFITCAKTNQPVPKGASVRIGFRLSAKRHQIQVERVAGLGEGVRDLPRGYVYGVFHEKEQRSTLPRLLLDLGASVKILQGDGASSAKVMPVNAGRAKMQETNAAVR
jgi:hypothetical protein